jgi:hypothetical protein
MNNPSMSAGARALSESTAAKANRPITREEVGKGDIWNTSTVILNTDARMRPTDAEFMPAVRSQHRD